MSRILLLEDDLSLVNGLSFAFKKRGASGSDGGGIQAFVPFRGVF